MENKNKAVIEFSANKINLVILQTKQPIYCNVVDYYSENLPLVEELTKGNLIRPVVIKEIIKILKSFRKICDNFQITEINAFMPTYFGEAKNIKSILEEVYNTCGITLTILSEEEQMKSLFSGAVNCTDLTKGIYFNVGDFETTIVQFNRRNLLNNKVLPYGFATLLKVEQEDGAAGVNKLLKKFKTEVSAIEFLKDIDEETCFLTNGDMALSIGALARKATRYPLDLVNNYVVNKDTFNNVYNLVAGLDLDKTKKLKGITEGSADKFKAGLELMKIFLDICNASQFSISEDALREGYVNSYIMPEIFDRPLSEMFAYSLENINAFFKVLNSNNEKVYELAINVFKQLRVIHKLPRNYVKPLRIAAYMYDCGKRISIDNYAKNGFHIILNSKIKGVSHKDLLLAAFACMYQEVDNFNLSEWVRYSAIVNEDDLDAIRKIGLIIKLSAALDCSKMSVIEDLSCDILGDSIIMKTIATKNPEFEIREAMKVNVGFKKVFSKFVEVI